jgi:ABC-type transporter Mla maintaining outer membrane lipid asymmetry permease subunit MlaE
MSASARMINRLSLCFCAASVLQISCAWGFTTTGGAKGVGESTTSAVVISLVTIFVADFLLSFAFFQGQGDALKQLK